METDWRSKLHAQQYLGQKDRISLRSALMQYCETRRGTANYPNLLSHFKVVCRLLPAGCLTGCSPGDSWSEGCTPMIPTIPTLTVGPRKRKRSECELSTGR